MRYPWLGGIAVVTVVACGPRSAADMSPAEKSAIADSLKRLVVSAYDLTPTGMNHVIGGAWTAVFQKRGGQWVIIQEHLSDVQSNPNLPMNVNPPGP